jgi:hypothetical protein
MTDVILLTFNTPSRFRYGRNSWIEETIPMEAIDVQALNERLQENPLYGEFDPEYHTNTVDVNNVCVKIEAVYISDGKLMGVISRHGPKGQALRSTIDAGKPVVLTMRAVKEYIKVPLVDRPEYDEVKVQKVKEIIAFDFYTSPSHITRVQPPQHECNRPHFLVVEHDENDKLINVVRVPGSSREMTPDQIDSAYKKQLEENAVKNNLPINPP